MTALYEICLHKADGTPILNMMVDAADREGAKAQAAKMLMGAVAYAVVWRSQVEVAIVHRGNPS